MQHGQRTSSTTRRLINALVLVAASLGAAALPSAADTVAHADTPAPPPPPPSRVIPDTPSRSDVSRALAERAAEVRSCAPANTPSGQVTVHVRFESSGAVQSVTVSSTTLPESAKSCIAEAVRKARVPPFRMSEFNVNFPYRY